MFENPVKSTDLAKTGSHELVAPVEISKHDIGAITMWFGSRDLVNDDLATFNFELNFKSFPLYSTFDIPDASKINSEAYPAFAQVDVDLRRELERAQGPLAIFIITTATVAEYPWLVQLPNGLLDFRRLQGYGHNTFVYKIILDWGFPQEGPEDPHGHYSKEEMKAHKLGGVFIGYSHDYRSLGIRRTIEFMNRVLGYDLPGEKFPNYSPEDTRKIAWSLRREDFNVFSPRVGAIPKYPIVDGKPQFPF